MNVVYSAKEKKKKFLSIKSNVILLHIFSFSQVCECVCVCANLVMVDLMEA